MARYDSTLRIFRILHYLETSRFGLKVSEIHKRLEHDSFQVEPRTVYRDLELLQMAHIPIERDENDGGDNIWRIKPFSEIRGAIQFTFQEIFALYVARKSLEHLRGTPIHSALDSLFLKIEKVLGTQTEMFKELLGNLEFRPQMTWHTSVAPVILDTVYSALDEGHELKILYRAEAGETAGQPKERVVGPECLYFAGGNVYLIAVDLSKGEPRTYALSRMIDAEMLNDRTYNKQGLSPERIFKSAIGILNTGDVVDVEILINGPIGTYVGERRWHESQETIRTPSGTTLRFQIKENDELVRFVLGLGPSAQVIKPESLRQKVEAMATDIAKIYFKKTA